MSSKIDFYDGYGSTARWLGSLQDDCGPDLLLTCPAGYRALAATDPTSFTDAVTTLLEQWPEHRLPPRNGWPRGDGHVHDWICAFDHGRVWMAIDIGRYWNPGQRVVSRSARSFAHGARRCGVTTGRTTTDQYPEGELRVEVRWEDGEVRWPLARVLRIVEE